MVAPEISGVPLRNYEIKHRNHRAVKTLLYRWFLYFKPLVCLKFKAFSFFASRANILMFCKTCSQKRSRFQLFTFFASRASVYTLCKFCSQNRSGFHPSLTLQAGQVDTQIWKIKFLHHSFCRLLGITPIPKIEINFCKIISSGASPKLMFL